MKSVGVSLDTLKDDIIEDIKTQARFDKEIQNKIQQDLDENPHNEVILSAKRVVSVLKDEIEMAIGTNYSDGYISRDAAIFLEDSLSSIFSYSTPKVNRRSVSIDVILDTNNGIMHRESLAPDDYPNGIDSIIELLNNGYKASGYVTGIWHGNQIKSLPKRSGAHYFENLTDDYLNKYRTFGVTSIYES